MAKIGLKLGQLTWQAFDKVNEQALNLLRRDLNAHPLDLASIRTSSILPKVDDYPDYLFLVLIAPRLAASRIERHPIHIFVNQKSFITLTHQDIPAINRLFIDLRKQSDRRLSLAKQGSFYLLYLLGTELLRDYKDIVDQLERDIESAEKTLRLNKDHTAKVEHITRLRRRILSFRRMVDPMSTVINNFIHLAISPPNGTGQTSPNHRLGGHAGSANELGVYFDDLRDTIETYKSILDGHKDNVQGLYEIAQSLINQRTNEVMKVLAIISVALLPLNLLASIYGMNIAGLPWTQNPGPVWLMFIILGGVIFLVASYLNRRGKL